MFSLWKNPVEKFNFLLLIKSKRVQYLANAAHLQLHSKDHVSVGWVYTRCNSVTD
jgi:hypothetical protein